MLVCGEFNGHVVGKASEGFNGVHSGNGFGSHNADGIRILDLYAAANLAFPKTFFTKVDSHLVSYWSGYSCTQIDCILTRRDLKLVQNVNMIRDEEYASQHKPLVYQINLRMQIRKWHKPPPKRYIWKLQKPNIQEI